MDPFQVETIYQRMTRDLYSDGGQIHGNAVAAIEEACWDIIGKVTGRPSTTSSAGAITRTCPPTPTAGTSVRAPPRALPSGPPRCRSRVQSAQVRPIRVGLADDDTV